MASIILNLLPLIVGAAVLPLWLIAALLLVRGQGGVRRAAAFAAGAMLVRVLQGILFGYVIDTAADAYGGGGSNLIASTLLLVVGILLLITAIRKWRTEEDPDAPSPQWMATLGRLSWPKAFGVGALWMTIAVKQWVFTLSAIAVIDEAKVGQGWSVFAYLVFVLAAHSLVLTPVLVSAVAPTQSAKLLDAMQGWLELHNRAITIAVSSIFGVWFLGKGIAGLLR